MKLLNVPLTNCSKYTYFVRSFYISNSMSKGIEGLCRIWSRNCIILMRLQHEKVMQLRLQLRNSILRYLLCKIYILNFFAIYCSNKIQ
jgi:hypothetical protein